MPVTLYPCIFIKPATVDESTPPDIATITFVSDGFLSNPIEFNSKFMWWYLYSFLL